MSLAIGDKSESGPALSLPLSYTAASAGGVISQAGRCGNGERERENIRAWVGIEGIERGLRGYICDADLLKVDHHHHLNDTVHAVSVASKNIILKWLFQSRGPPTCCQILCYFFFYRIRSPHSKIIIEDRVEI